MYPLSEYVIAGGLMSYGASLREGFRQMGIYVAKILSGSMPSDLPILQSAKFELTINMRTAKSLGISVPAGLLALADEVIEEVQFAAAHESGYGPKRTYSRASAMSASEEKADMTIRSKSSAHS
jgi:hypothetical protein